MAEILRYVDPNALTGGDGTTNGLTGATRAYSSLSSWEAAQQQDLTDGGGDTARVVCSSDDAGSTHAADTTAVLVDGWTTSVTCDITIEAASSHGGKWNDNIYRLPTTTVNTASLDIREDYTKIIGIQCYFNASSYSSLVLYGITGGLVNKCILRGSGNAVSSYVSSSGTNTIINSIIYDAATKGIRNYGLGTLRLYNSSIQNCPTGFSHESGTAYSINGLYRSCATNAATGTFAAGTDYNATDNASMGYTVTGGGNSHDRLSQTFAFVNEGADDFHLASNDTGAKDYGVSDPGSGLFSDDIDGVARTGTWDIGADEYVAVGGGSAGGIMLLMDHFNGGTML